MLYLDDLDPSELTDEQKEEFRKMFNEDPYHFYNLWRDPDAAQRYFEGDDFKTTPASEVYLKLGALQMAGAPQAVIDSWADVLKHKGRQTDDAEQLPPKTRPVESRLTQIDCLCRHINEEFNCTIDNVTPVEGDFPDEVPFAAKWQQVMNLAMGKPEVSERHDVVAKHYKATDTTRAYYGVEILEINIIAESADIDLGDCFDDVLSNDAPAQEPIHPDGVRVERHDQYVTLYFEYFNCYE